MTATTVELAAVLARAELAATLFMTGLIWFVQVVHYPLFARVAAVAPADWPDYERRNTRRTGWVVGPPMLAEAALATQRALAPAADRLALAALALLAVVWLSTLLLQIPAHRRLERTFDPVVHRRLVRTNWIRTLAWTGRALLLAVT